MNKNKLYLLASLLLLTAACGEDEALTTDNMPEEALRLQSVTVPDGNDTRASALGAAQLTEVGVYATNNADAALGSNAQSVYTYKSGNWTATNPPSINSSIETPDKLYAFYPSDLVVTNGGSGGHTVPVKVVPDNFTASAQTDYLYSGTPVTAYDGKRSVAFELKHALAKVSFRINKAVEEQLLLKKVEILSATGRLQTGSNATMNLTTGVLEGLAVTSSLELTGATPLDLPSQAQTPNISSLVAPMKGTEQKLSFRLTVQVGDETEARVFETSVVSGDGVQWLAGHHYTYARQVNKIGGSLLGVKIDKWKNDANQNTGIGI